MSEPEESSARAVLICGLGRLGKHCAVLLKELGIPVFGLHDVDPKDWESEGLSQVLDRLTVGDCRRHAALERAGIRSCRAVLLTTRDERVNVSAAFAARSLNAGVRLVIRSSKSNLNQLLQSRLGNLIALDVDQLPATAFSLAAVGGETIGMFSVEGELLRVVENRITSSHRWHDCRVLHELDTRWRRVLHRTSADHPQPIDFHGWDPNERVRTGDLVISVELGRLAQPRPAAQTKSVPAMRPAAPRRWSSPDVLLRRAWAKMHQTLRITAVATLALSLLHLTGMLLYRARYPEVSLLDAFNVATVLIFDGYSNMFAQLKLPFPIPLWLLLFSLMLTMSGAVVTGIFYAYLTARVLSARIQFRRRPGRVPRSNHTVVIGMGPLGMHVAKLLGDLNQQVAAVVETELEPSVLPAVPVITGDPHQCLQKANCATAASIVVVTDDDVQNLELALMAAQLNENCNLVIRADDIEFARNVRLLAPRTEAMSVYALSAEAYAAAALGERVLSLLRIGTQTVLATEYKVERGDTLDQRLIGEATCGYGLVAVLYQRHGAAVEFFPSEDIRIEAGSRLVVLATIDGLQAVEHGVTAARPHQVRLLRAATGEAIFEGSRTIARITGYELGAARDLLGRLPVTLPPALFHHQAERLVRELNANNVEAEVIPAVAS